MLDHSHHHIDRDWQHRASCRGTDTDRFFSPDGERGSVRAQREHAAKQICQDCPVLAECRTHALTTEAYGIWGGMSESERARHTRLTRLAARPRECVARPDPRTAPDLNTP
ncbi:WhiB family transcriptional regulator [Rhodococcus opacus]|nr:WhiB family transcriptional regulator [Rhodococcus opacus]